MATAEIVIEQAPEASSWVLPRRIPELDGIRGIAILLVLVHHEAFWMAPSPLRSVLERGVAGVDLFFVLSGFLITGILLDSKHQPSAARNFYVKRGLRIWPLYFAFLGASMLLLRRMMPAHFALWPYLLLVQNFFYFTSMGPVLEPTWSLAVEEQFYLVWPWIVLRLSRQTVGKICVAVVTMSPLVRLAFRMAGAHPRFLYANTLCRLDPIAMGALIAAWVRSPEITTDKLARFLRAALPIGVAGWALCFLAPAAPACRELRLSFVTITFGASLVAALLCRNSDAFFSKALRSSHLKTVARISFALYLFNLPVYSIMHGNFFTRLFAGMPWGLAAVTSLVISNAALFAAAALSWRFFESRILRLKERL